MKLVLLSGGSGKRLWPLSNDARSKQFLKVLEDENGNLESMVQRVWRQLKKNNLIDDAVIATGKNQVEMIYSQIGEDTPTVSEPERRDTFPAIALATVYLYDLENVSPEEVITILPVDPYVEDRFFERIKDLENVIATSQADLALIGVTPTYPSEKYGYIVPKKQQDKDFYTVDYFKEKPDHELAQALIDQSALWNCGVFAFKLDYMLKVLKEKGLPIQYEALLKQYPILLKNSFDFEVVEKAQHIAAISYDGIWKDLGTWNVLTEEIPNYLVGKGVVDKDTKNTHVINELDIPITLIGINDAIVVASPDGILVSHKEASQKIKSYTHAIEGRPMYEERRWGWYRVLEYKKYPAGNEVLTKRIGINAGKNLSYQVHYKRNEVWTVIKGEGVLVLEDRISHIRVGDVIHIPLASKHAVRATTDMELIEVQTGSELVEEDIYRIVVSWKEIESIIQPNVMSK
ncbi:sugar phosphate nucleotidyltransferase [Amphibacillus cookii]|uniref:sugar phosphate nucleotidyltransferase n=1 Tax=Amphibacillus cookii TaxID=767787 RepID=UPI00195CF3F1|nr:sugar phosphate nucleotidyltransferase [Amphibacillus cookii]MBM7540681.1 mannose-1-phosphate guanylyltransferase [Amphibacillus cookii]